MKCPICVDESLVMAEWQGIEIDYCPKCRGVWLDRGELDKIIERSASSPPDKGFRDESRESSPYPQSGKYRKKSILGELFDF